MIIPTWPGWMSSALVYPTAGTLELKCHPIVCDGVLACEHSVVVRHQPREVSYRPAPAAAHREQQEIVYRACLGVW